jgi:hypothetical protein
MRQKFFYFTAIAVCLALTLAPAMAAERTTERADRTDRGAERGVTSSGSEDPILSPPAISGKRGLAGTLQLGNDGSNGRAARLAGISNPDLLLGRAAYLAERGQTDRAIATYQRVLQLNLASNAENDKIRFAVNRALAGLYEGAPHKQVHYLSAALQYAPAGEQAALEDAIFELGGDVFGQTFNNGASKSNKAQVRANDCSTANPAAVGAGFVTISPGVTIPATHDWYVFDVTNPDGSVVSIETRPNGASASEDTDLTLYTGTCDALVFVQFDDDSGAGFASLIQTSCIDAGTYYVEVGGWLDIVAPGSYDLRVDVGDCPVDLPLDRYEPDDTPDVATTIGHKASHPGNGNAWGRVNRETQAHSIALGGDTDDVKFSLAENSFVRSSTAVQHASFFNDFEYIGLEADGSTCLSADGSACDTTIELIYNDKKEYGGLCFDDAGFQGAFTCECPQGDVLDFPGGCYSDAEADALNAALCPRPDGTFNQYCPFVGPSGGAPGGGNACNSVAIAGFGSCSNMQDNVSGDPFGCDIPANSPPGTVCPHEPVAVSTDRSASDYGSEFAMCLPQTDGSVDPSVTGPWHIRVTGFGLQQFEYEVRVTPESRCDNWEVEPNDSLLDPMDITLGDTIHAMSSHSRAQENLGENLGSFYGEDDLFAFNPPALGVMTLETTSYDANRTDTYIALYIGPDPVGNFLFSGFANDDGGDGVLSRLALPPLPPAPDLFGGFAPDAQYILNVNNAFLSQDYPYSLTTSFAGLAASESEPNDVFAGGTPMLVQMGDTINAEIGGGDCGDMFMFEIDEDGFISVQTRGFTDTVMQMVDCETGAEFLNTCDDDGGAGVGSKIEGCMAAGTYCMRVTGFNVNTFGDYDLTVNRTGGCVALDPMLITYDDGIGCGTENGNTCRP